MLRLVILFFALFTAVSTAQETAQSLFNQLRHALYQIQIIELGSGKKSSIGSGFQVNPEGDLVTNYHVVSDFVYYPDKYRIEYLDADGNRGPLKLKNFDVVNDLALVSREPLEQTITLFDLAQQLPTQGTPIYSLGNPHDLGMIVVPGTFNGLKSNSFYQRIHFTGSINPGMSGGPAVNKAGEVIGVNVSTAGNQIGFLIPLQKITALLEDPNKVESSAEFKSKIQTQLVQNQHDLINTILDNTWQTSNLGEAVVPDKIADFISCWGGSNTSDEKAFYLSVENRCRLDEQIYLNESLRTGAFEMEFEWLSSSQFNSHRFYNFYSQSISGAGPGNAAGKEDVTNYRCQRDLVTNKHQVTSKTVLCLRAYKDFSSLYDVLFIGASLDHQQQGLISHFTLAGVNKSSALSFTQFFVDSIAWQ